MPEYWDIYDENERKTGRTHRRGDPMEKGDYHLGVDIWVLTGDGKLLITLRDPKKDDCPGQWENTCGSVLAGETALEGALRELREETGLIAVPQELHLIGRRVGGNTISYTYLLRRDVDVAALRFQDGETVAARLVTPMEIEKLIGMPHLAWPLAERWPWGREELGVRSEE